jgi:hypothetical protein
MAVPLLTYRPEEDIVLLPHPSGRNLMWNDPGIVERARHLLRGAGILPP